MSKLQVLLTNAYRNAYTLSKNLYTEPKIYDADGDLSKRWYVYYYYRNPVTEKLVLQPPLYMGVNRLKTKKERTEMLIINRIALHELLKKGYNPYETYKETDKRIEQQKKPAEGIEIDSQRKNYTVKEALFFALKQRKPHWKKKTAGTMVGHFNRFIEWLTINKLIDKNISELKKRDVSTFLNSLTKLQTKKQKQLREELVPVSPKTRNNFRATLSTLFAQLEEDEIIERNFITQIKINKSTPKKNKPFSKEQIIDIREYLDKNDPYLRTFIQFMSYAFLRNVEVCRLQVKDIDLASKRLYVRSKTAPLAIVPIIGELETVLRDMKLENYAPTDFVITRFEKPANWDIDENNKTNYFSKKFKLIKRILGYSDDYSLYSVRHTAATNIYNSLLAEGKSEEGALMHLMSITRHRSKAGLKNYLREIGATLPKDYSDMYTIDF
ncbi:Tyrosine recombinase XerC [Kordia antarctica]|uniref:Tyrosine recombinase XerC n=1 Tax=Kordia antarctica TaxID=1218801 RepID=A0A7L4ZGW8_9FLAO|nr:site-specific integrase [Kordia antarctica]QHI35770.1 Tyrosine recombinase XerC [Kordia antarctica]